MARKEKIAIGFFLARVSSRPQMVALIPQVEKIDEHSGVQILPPGIHLCQLPYADDIRSHGLSSTKSIVPDLSKLQRQTVALEPASEAAPVLTAPDQLEDTNYIPDLPAVEAANEIVRYMTRPYNPDSYPNPSLNLHYETLAALCLNEPLPEQDDRTVPFYHTIDKRVGKFVERLKQEVGVKEDDLEEEEEGKPRKRARDAGASDDEMRRFARTLQVMGEKTTADVSRRSLRAACGKLIRSFLRGMHDDRCSRRCSSRWARRSPARRTSCTAA